MQFLGKIEVPNTQAKNNRNTTTSFVIPDDMKYIAVYATGACKVEFGRGDTFTTDAAKGFPLAATTRYNLPRPRLQDAVLAVRNDSGAAIEVQCWAAAEPVVLS